ncbi:MAG: class I mannose-6-phosphate isomerase [Flavobacteriaceae bacterium]|nr:class I mannose-6-phosphate isomerase [Flavobacteriaceae bacterium]
MILEPIKFKPIIKEKIWGGIKLKTLLGKKSGSDKIGESWEISSVDTAISVAITTKDSGKTLTELIQKYKGKLVGEKVYNKFGNKFPLLIKYIDAKENLSIQLHPNDELAQKRHQCFGKTEMWYVMQADKNAELIVGFKQKTSKKEYVKSLKNNKIKELLNVDKVNTGDVYFIKTGTIHAIGAGVMLAEIQQTSDITYRIYDWDRKDTEGNLRKLHTEDALDAIDFEVKETYLTTYTKTKNKAKLMVKCPYFTTNILQVESSVKVNHSKKDSFIIYMCVQGNVIFAHENKTVQLNYGESLLIPNSLNEFEILSNKKSELLEIYIN